MSTNPMTRVAEPRHSLWLLAASPAIWAAHFLLSLWTVRVAILVYTVAALAAIVGIGYVGFASHRLGSASLPHDDDTPQDRRRFLGFATFLLSGLSAVAVIYAALVAVYIETCQ